MVAYFPIPYFDELLYSVIARFKDHTNATTHQVIRDLFDDVHFKVNFLFPKRIKTVVRNLSHIANFDEKELILDRTLFPFITSMRSEIKADRIYNYMAEGGLSHSFIPIDGMKRQVMRYCTLCAKEDREILGETYWHRTHNIPTIKTCLKHNIDLNDWKPKTNHIFTSRLFSAEEVVDVDLASTNVYAEERVYDEYLADILLNRRVIDFGRIRTLSLKLNYVSLANGKYIVDQKLFNDLGKYISRFHARDEYLIPFVPAQVKKIISGKFVGKYPKLVWILEKFLGGITGVEANPNREINCINKLCSNFEKDIGESNWRLRKYGEDQSRNGFVAKCPACLMEYSSSFESDDSVHIFSYGHLVEKTVKALKANGDSMRKIGSHLELCPQTVKRILEKPNSSERKNRKRPPAKEQIVIMREKWKEELNSPDFISITISASKLKSVYRWLARHDNEWIVAYNKKFYIKKPYSRRYSLVEIDEQVLQELTQIYNSITHQKLERRITKKLLTSHLTTPGRAIESLPRSQAFIKSVSETSLDYFKRRIKNLVAEQKHEFSSAKALLRRVNYSNYKVSERALIESFVVDLLRAQHH